MPSKPSMHRPPGYRPREDLRLAVVVSGLAGAMGWVGVSDSLGSHQLTAFRSHAYRREIGENFF
jgi:hypothetical protein